MSDMKPMFEILDESEIKSRIAQRIADENHWIIIPSLTEGLQSLMAFEEQFYWDEANADFELTSVLLGGDVPMTIAVANKSRCSAQQMTDFLNSRMHAHKSLETGVVLAIAPDTVSTHDIQFWGSEKYVDLMGQIFYHWINQAFLQARLARN